MTLIHAGRAHEVLRILPQLGAPGEGTTREPSEQDTWRATARERSDAAYEVDVGRLSRRERLTLEPLASPPCRFARLARKVEYLVEILDLLGSEGLSVKRARHRVGRGAPGHDADNDGARIREERCQHWPIVRVGVHMRAGGTLAEIDHRCAASLLEQRGEARARDDAHHLCGAYDDVVELRIKIDVRRPFARQQQRRARLTQVHLAHAPRHEAPVVDVEVGRFAKDCVVRGTALHPALPAPETVEVGRVGRGRAFAYGRYNRHFPMGASLA